MVVRVRVWLLVRWVVKGLFMVGFFGVVLLVDVCLVI